MGGPNVNTTFYNALSAMAMLFGRYHGILPLLAMAGSLIQKKRLPQGAGILRESSVLMILFVAFVIVVLGAITFLPAFALGPLAAQWAILPPP